MSDEYPTAAFDAGLFDPDNRMNECICKPARDTGRTAALLLKRDRDCPIHGDE